MALFQALTTEYNGDLEPFRKEMKGDLIVNVIEGERLYVVEGGTKINPYVRVGVGAMRKTKIAKNKTDPVWKEQFKCEHILLYSRRIDPSRGQHKDDPRSPAQIRSLRLW